MAEAAGAQPTIVARGVSVGYAVANRGASVLALQGVSVDIFPREFVSIVGPSGCGKSTFLYALAGLVPISAGALTFNGQPIVRPGPDRPVVFQQPSLFPWRTALGNVLYPLQLARIPKQVAYEQAMSFLRLVGLEDFADAYPTQLSGGMQQRVNIARALTVQPQMLLFDEPLASLDALSRELMQEELLRIWQERQVTALFVTHQLDEAVYLSDRVIVFSARPGRILKTISIDLPRPRPLSIKHADFFARYVDEIWRLLEGEVRKTMPHQAARTGGGTLQLDPDVSALGVIDGA